MTRGVFGMHGAGGNGYIIGGYGSNGEQPTGNFITMGGWDGGGRVNVRQPDGSMYDLFGMPGNNGWNDAVTTAAYITAACNALGVTELVVTGFSYGGGGCTRLWDYGFDADGRIKGFIVDDPAGYTNVYFAGSTLVGRRVYYCTNGIASGPYNASQMGTTAIANPLGNGRHIPMTPVPGIGGTGYPDLLDSGGTVSGVAVPSMWTASGGTPPPTGDRTRYEGETFTVVNPLPDGARVSSENPGASGGSSIQYWWQAGEGIRRTSVSGGSAGGTFSVVVGYHCAETAGAARRIRVNGVDIKTHPFPKNAAFWGSGEWTETTITGIPLNAGPVNTVELWADTNGGIDFDYLDTLNATGTPTPPTGGGGIGQPIEWPDRPGTFTAKAELPAYRNAAAAALETMCDAGWDGIWLLDCLVEPAHDINRSTAYDTNSEVQSATQGLIQTIGTEVRNGGHILEASAPGIAKYGTLHDTWEALATGVADPLFLRGYDGVYLGATVATQQALNLPHTFKNLGVPNDRFNIVHTVTSDTAAALHSLATYLCFTDGNAVIGVSPDAIYNDPPAMGAEFLWDLGLETTARTNPAAGVYMRKFAKGIAVTNLSTVAATVALGGTYYDAAGTAVTSVALPAASGIVMQNTGSTVPTPPPSTRTSRVLSGVSIFPSNNFAYADVSPLPVRADSSTRILGHLNDPTYRPEWGTASYFDQVYPDFGSGFVNGRPFGFPLTVVPSTEPTTIVRGFNNTYGEAESDIKTGGVWPVPSTTLQEHNSDYHILILQQGTNLLYEAWDAHWQASPAGWIVGQDSRWNLTSNAARPLNWTSADAAGLPILPLSLDYDEVNEDRINHAMRMCVTYSSAEYEWPANHVADYSLGVRPDRLRMGSWLRLKASVDLNSRGLGAHAKRIAAAMKKHGCIIIDIGPFLKLNALYDSRWNNNDLGTLRGLHAADFELVDTSSIRATTTDRTRWLEIK